jgi:CheY-like chemotaxis protein
MPLLNNIMLIDDDRATNYFHEYVIRQLKCADHVTEKLYASEALNYLQDDKHIWPELILLDINMPRMNGWEFLDAYRKLEKDQKEKTIIVMLTTSENPDDKAKAHTIKEINEFVIKPLTEEKLRALMRKYFEEKV